jgi:hypothetical protein
MFTIGPKVRKGAGASIPEASADDPIYKRGYSIGITNSSNISPEQTSPHSNDQSNAEIIMNKQINLTPQQMVEKFQKHFPDTEVRLSREGDPELSMVLINVYPLSSQSNTNTPQEQSEKNSNPKNIKPDQPSPQEQFVKELENKGVKVNVFSKKDLKRKRSRDPKPGDWPRE